MLNGFIEIRAYNYFFGSHDFDDEELLIPPIMQI